MERSIRCETDEWYVVASCYRPVSFAADRNGETELGGGRKSWSARGRTTHSSSAHIYYMTSCVPFPSPSPSFLFFSYFLFWL